MARMLKTSEKLRLIIPHGLSCTGCNYLKPAKDKLVCGLRGKEIVDDQKICEINEAEVG